MSFRKRPETASDASADAWVGAAPLRAAADTTRPWKGLDPDAPPTVAFNLRLNGYQIALLRAAAKKTRRSQQQAVKAILIAALEREVLEPE